MIRKKIDLNFCNTCPVVQLRLQMRRYLNPKNYVRYFLNRSINLTSTVLKPLEKYLAEKYGEQGLKNHPPVFIIGSPRCGSTLLYKVLTERYGFSFFSNLTAKFYRVPICGTWLQGKLGIRSLRGNYEFKYGNASGLGSPSECGEFWYRWFPKGLHVYVGPDRTDREVLDELRWAIGGVSYVRRSPILIKNLYNSMRIAPIVEAIPESIFIVCRRNYIENALSILKGRKSNLTSEDIWWSLPPKEVDQLIGRNYAEQVAGQVHFTYRQIEEDKARFGADRFLEILYEDFCDDVYGTLRKIEMFLARKGCTLSKKCEVPARFNVRRLEGVDSKDRKLVQQAVKSFLKENESRNL